MKYLIILLLLGCTGSPREEAAFKMISENCLFLNFKVCEIKFKNERYCKDSLAREAVSIPCSFYDEIKKEIENQ